ncbi:MAG: phage tail sheath family protein [Acidaminococcus fermentans]|nr:phage tail sheath family protein [Acidaminococcus fermentans]
MAYKHGVYVSEVPTSVVPMTETDAGLPVVFGTAPVHLATEPAAANRPQICYSYDEAVKAFGYSSDWEKYTLCEVLYSQFSLFARGPVVLVNVLDPKKHKKHIADQSVTLTDGQATIEDAVLVDTLEVKKNDGTSTLVKGTDYEAEHDDDGNLVLTILAKGVTGTVKVSYDALDATAVTADDIVGGVDTDTGAYKGLECLNQVFPLTGLIPGFVLAPGWSDDPTVAAVMVAKAANINEHFRALALTDISTKEVKKYSDAPEWKKKNNYTSANQVALWPCFKLGDKVFHGSTELLGVAATVDSNNDDIPYVSPSNHSAQGNGLCLEDGTEVILGPEQANYLNGQGIVCGLNFMGGLKIWGNRTGCYPDTTDPKDAFIPIRRMFNWVYGKVVTTFWSQVDGPVTKRVTQTVADSVNIWLNGLTAMGVILGGRIEFLSDENPTTNLEDGIVRFHIYLTPPPAGREIDMVLEYDVNYIQNLFA